MKRFFAFLLTASIGFCFFGCGTHLPTADTSDAAQEQAITWESTAEEKPTEMLTNLTEDAITALLQDSYQNTVQFGDIAFTAEKIETRAGEMRMDFTVTAAYCPLIEGENPAAPLTLGEEQLLELPMRVTAEEENGKIIPESLLLETRDTQNGKESTLSPTYFLPQIGDSGINTLHGAVADFAEDNGAPCVVVNQMLWVEDTHSYTDNGSFLLDLAHRYTLPLDAACEVHYYAEDGIATYLPLEEYRASGYNFADTFYEINFENGFVRHIVELYKPETDKP